MTVIFSGEIVLFFLTNGEIILITFVESSSTQVLICCKAFNISHCTLASRFSLFFFVIFFCLQCHICWHLNKNLTDPALMQSKELYLKVLQRKKGGKRVRTNDEEQVGWPTSSLSSSFTTHSILINLKTFPWFSFPSFALPLALLLPDLISSFLLITFFFLLYFFTFCLQIVHLTFLYCRAEQALCQVSLLCGWHFSKKAEYRNDL